MCFGKRWQSKQLIDSTYLTEIGKKVLVSVFPQFALYRMHDRITDFLFTVQKKLISSSSVITFFPESVTFAQNKEKQKTDIAEVELMQRI